jgi:hypothetical protein
MASIPNPSAIGPRSGSSPPGSNASSAKPPPQRTQMMDAAAFARANPIPTPSRSSAPSQLAAQPVPPSVAHPPPPATVQPYSHGQAPPQPTPGQWGVPQPPAPPAPPPAIHGGGYGFGYAPGARVNVTWSNGQRYPATVSQVSGAQCLVVFPDGQQHWVEMQYLSPA